MSFIISIEVANEETAQMVVDDIKKTNSMSLVLAEGDELEFDIVDISYNEKVQLR